MLLLSLVAFVYDSTRIWVIATPEGSIKVSGRQYREIMHSDDRDEALKKFMKDHNVELKQVEEAVTQ